MKKKARQLLKAIKRKTGSGQTRSATATPTAAADQPVVPMDVGAEGVRAEGIEQPTVVSLSPDTAVAGEGQQVDHDRRGHRLPSEVRDHVRGHDEPTTFIDATHVSTG